MENKTSIQWDRIGSFYLGKKYDSVKSRIDEQLFLYDSKDLTTHALCVGMTGSGKTGLCLALIEEAMLDGVPAILIDPKGDLGNLCLTFPEMSVRDFEPWVDPDEANRKGLSVHAYADQVSKTWSQGIQSWGQDQRRLERLKDSARVSIFTPGSSAGIPIRLLRSFRVPSKEVMEDAQALQETVDACVSSLLSLIGKSTCGVQSKEHVFLSNLILFQWKQNISIDLQTMISWIQQPPFSTLGVLDIESYYPLEERTELMHSINGLLASPSFELWNKGQELSIPHLLWTQDGKPRVSILNISHLSDDQRMSFVTTVLSELNGWIRTQSGTSSLRAIFYMDEIFGYFPPVKNPPSKAPMLSLLKQARAFGLGCVLSTQNPVDLDYKGLSNIGTWLLGRLQTKQDVDRVIEGLSIASSQDASSLDSESIGKRLSNLSGRVFLCKNIHEDELTMFHTRWVLSYLRGPLTKDHIQNLMANEKKAYETMDSYTSKIVKTVQNQSIASKSHTKPLIPSQIDELYWEESVGQTTTYSPMIFGKSKMHFKDSKAKADFWEDRHLSMF
ncbi:MAG: DUF87 domain-containing protein [Bdellovibrionota bacterium]